MDRMATLAALCDTFVPGDATLPSASALGVPRLIRSELEALGRPSLVSELDLLLRMVENPLASLALVGRPVRFTSLSPAERERYVKALGDSAIPLKRVAFQDLKRLALLIRTRSTARPTGTSLGTTRRRLTHRPRHG